MTDDRRCAPGDGRQPTASTAASQVRAVGRVKARIYLPDTVLEQRPQVVGHLLEVLVGCWGLGAVEVVSDVPLQLVQKEQVMCSVRVGGYRVSVVLEAI